MATLSVEDVTNFKNMNYMATLRPDRSFSQMNNIIDGGNSQQNYIDNAPSFYEEDMKRWQKKFERAVQNR